MRRTRHTHCSSLLLLALALALLVACERTGDDATPDKRTPPTGTTTPGDDDNSDTQYPFSPYNSVKRIPPKGFRNHWTPIQPSRSVKTGFDSGVVNRLARRVSLRKLRNTIPHLLGGITWRDKRGANMFDKYAITLGRADYIQLNNDNDEVTKLFMKLMDDMATNVCKQAIAADFKQTDAARRHFVRDQKDVNKTLRYIRLKFHGLYVPANQTDGIKPYRSLYDKVLAAKKDNKVAWELVCVATLTAPEFFVY